MNHLLEFLRVLIQDVGAWQVFIISLFIKLALIFIKISWKYNCNYNLKLLLAYFKKKTNDIEASHSINIAIKHGIGSIAMFNCNIDSLW